MILSSLCSAGTIFFPVYRRRAARERYFCVLSFAALLRALKFLSSPLQNGGVRWNGRGGACVPAQTSAQRRFHTKIYLRIMHEDLTMDAPLQGDTGEHTGTAPTKLHQTTSSIHVQSTHNQRPHRPRSCNTIHCLEIDESANTFTFPSRRFRGESERVRTAIHKVDGAGFQGVILRTGPIPIVG